MMLHVSAMDHARKLKFSSYVHLPSMNKILAWVLYFRFGTCDDVNIKQLCSSSMYKFNLKIRNVLGRHNLA